jgi:hypothetical protein
MQRQHRSFGRKFYTCPLGQNDPKRCSYFKWADDIAPSSTGQRLGASTPTVDLLNRVKERYEGNPPQIIGQSPNNRYGKPSGIPASASVSTPTAGRTMVPMTPETHSKLSISRDYDVGDGAAIQEETEEIDWDKVDTDSLERDAIASTPGSSQLLSQQSLLAANDTTTLQQRLMSVAKETPSRAEGSEGKRKREVEDDRDKTPKRPVVDTEDVSGTSILLDCLSTLRTLSFPLCSSPRRCTTRSPRLFRTLNSFLRTCIDKTG